MNNTRKLIFLVDRLDFGGGVERIVSLMAREFFHPYDREVALISRRELQHKTNCPIKYFGNIRHESTGTIRAIFEFIATLIRFGIYRALKKPSAVISFKEVPNFVNVMTLGRNSIVSVRENKSHGIRFHGMRKSLVVAFIRIVYNRAEQIVTSSIGVKDDLVNQFGIDVNRITVIPNPCDNDYIALQSIESLNEDWQFLEETKYVVAVGRLSIEKGFFNLIRIFNALVQKQPEVHLVIVGEGAEFKPISRLIKQYALQSRVHLIGHQANPHKFMKHAVVTAVTSYWEGFCNVIVESMACGTPVISTDCPDGPRSILEPSLEDASPLTDCYLDAAYGVLSPPIRMVTDWNAALTPEEQIFLSALARFFTDEDLAIKYTELGKIRAQDYSINIINDLWSKMLENILKNSR